MSTIIETAQVEQQGLALVTDAKALVIQDEPSYQRAGLMLRTVKDYLRRVAEVCEPVVSAAWAAHRAAVAQRTNLEAPAKEAEGVLKRAMIGYTEEIDRQRRETQRRAAAEVEAARLAAVAEEEERQVAAAMEAEANGQEEQVAAILTAPIVVAPFTPPVVLPSKPKVEGVSYREDWTAEIFDLLELVRAVAAGRQPVSLLQPDMTVLNGMARALKSVMNVPGVRSVSRRVVAARN